MRVGEYEIYDAIDQLPITKFNDFKKHYMIYKEVGGDFTAYDMHHVKLNQLIQKEMKREALVQLSNMRNCVFKSMNGYNPEFEAFRALVKGDTEGIERLTIGQVREAIEVVKKNSLMN